MSAETAQEEFSGKAVILMYKGLEIICSNNFIVSESPLWDEKTKSFFFVDILGCAFYKLDYCNGKYNKTELPQQVGCLALCENGDIILSMCDGIYFMDSRRNLRPAHTKQKIKGRRFNDGKVAADGLYYVGTTDDNRKGAFYRMDNNGLTELFDCCGCSNGLDWNFDNTKMFYCDSREQKIEEFDFSISSHNISARKTIREIPLEWGSADGMTIDATGNLWVALWGGYGVINVDPKNGKIIKKVELPVEKVSSCCFGGEDMKDLIITTASLNSDLSKEKNAGSIFRYRCDVPGIYINRYKGEI